MMVFLSVVLSFCTFRVMLQILVFYGFFNTGLFNLHTAQKIIRLQNV